MMNKYKMAIIAGVTIIILVAGGALLFSKKDHKSASSNTATSNNTNTKSTDSAKEDLGLCKLVDKDTIKVALGAAAVKLSGPNDSGVNGLGEGDKGQTCFYPFAEGGVDANSFYTDLAVYSQKSFDKISSFTATTGDPVSGIGDMAVYESIDLAGTNAKEFTITSLKGTKVYRFVISQSKDAKTYDDATARTALTKIAQAAKL